MGKIPILFKLLAERNISQLQLANAIDVSSGNVSDWKSGKSAPTMDALIKIADFLDCSIDYLLGRTDNPNSHKL